MKLDPPPVVELPLPPTHVSNCVRSEAFFLFDLLQPAPAFQLARKSLDHRS